MAKLDELVAANAALQAQVDEVASSITAAKAAVEAAFARLEALLAAGVSGISEGDLQPILDGLQTAKDKLVTADAAVDATKGEADSERP